MKWYKHISDSLDDPFIFDLLDRFGSDGYLVFFGVLEIYSREFKTEVGWNLSVTQAYLKQKLHKRQGTLVENILKHISNSGKWNVSFDSGKVIVFIPKFTELMDEWTQRKLGSKSGDTPKILGPDKDKDKDKDKDIPPIPPTPNIQPSQQKAKTFIPPTIEEVKKYFLENGYSEQSAVNAFKYYQDGNPPWTDSKGNHVRSWKQKMRAVWFKEENRKPKITLVY